MVKESIQSLESFQFVLKKAEEYLCILSSETPYSDFESKFEEIGLERGWGNTAERVQETIRHLLHLLEAPNASSLENFLGRIPLVFNVVILTPHGYFAQENVLGYPDTGGQVCVQQKSSVFLYCKFKKFSFLIKSFIPSESQFLNRLFTFLIKFQQWRLRCFSA